MTIIDVAFMGTPDIEIATASLMGKITILIQIIRISMTIAQVMTGVRSLSYFILKRDLKLRNLKSLFIIL